jgi:hypothetical protein
MKNKFHVVIKLIAVLLLGITVAGCASTQHGVEISNVPNVRELYIRNAGTTDWGPNIANNMKNIDKSRFSEKVDVKVIDNNGIVYTKDNVPSDFVETGKTSSMNDFALLLLAGGALVLLLTVL